MSELLAILLTGAIGMSVSYGLMLLFKIKPGEEISSDDWAEGYIIGQQMDRLFCDD